MLGITPENGSTGVDPALARIVVRFSRPMRSAYATVLGPGGAAAYPETPSAEWDATGTVFTMNVRLKPGWTYEFFLNRGNLTGFTAVDGYPLAPYAVRFTTAPAR